MGWIFLNKIWYWIPQELPFDSTLNQGKCFIHLDLKFHFLEAFWSTLIDSNFLTKTIQKNAFSSSCTKKRLSSAPTSSTPISTLTATASPTSRTRTPGKYWNWISRHDLILLDYQTNKPLTNKNGPITASFSLFSLTVNIVNINFANDWIRTADLLYRKWLLGQLSHNYCPKTSH